jgi:hypothetical protein
LHRAATETENRTAPTLFRVDRPLSRLRRETTLVLDGARKTRAVQNKER